MKLFKTLSFLILLKGSLAFADNELDMKFIEAAAAGHVEEVSFYLSQGADLNAVDIKGRTALHRACYYRPRTVAFLLKQEGLKIDAKDKEGKTPLHIAVSISNNILKMLVKAKANVNIKLDHSSPLHTAAEASNFNAVKILVEAGANINAVDRFNRTPAFLAFFNDNEEILNFLIEKGTDLNIRSIFDKTLSELMAE